MELHCRPLGSVQNSYVGHSIWLSNCKMLFEREDCFFSIIFKTRNLLDYVNEHMYNVYVITFFEIILQSGMAIEQLFPIIQHNYLVNLLKFNNIK